MAHVSSPPVLEMGVFGKFKTKIATYGPKTCTKVTLMPKDCIKKFLRLCPFPDPALSSATGSSQHRGQGGASGGRAQPGCPLKGHGIPPISHLMPPEGHIIADGVQTSYVSAPVAFLTH